MIKTVKLTVAQALVKFLSAQKIEIEGETESLFGCAFAIFGHGNVTCLGQQLHDHQEDIPVWRGQNEQSMAFAAIAYAKANKRKRIGIAISSIGPGSSNMVTAAGVAHSNRLPLLLISGDSFNSRLPDPVLQQPENFYDPTLTVSDCFKPVTRYWDRITSAEQLLHSLPHAIATMLDPSDCGPVYLGLPQDVQAHVYDYPECFFDEKVHRIRRPQAEAEDIVTAAEVIKKAKQPVIIAGGGVFYSGATNTLLDFAKQHNIPVVETIAGRTCLLASEPLNCGPIGPTGSDSAKALTENADVVLAVGTRLQDFVTGSWSTFRNPDMQLVAINTARFDATKHRAISVIADAKTTLEQLSHSLGDYSASEEWTRFYSNARNQWLSIVAERTAFKDTQTPSYAQIIGQVNQLIDAEDRVITAAGGLPAELNMNWLATSQGNFDIEFGFSCMGYEVAGGWGAKMACPSQEVIVLVGDGSYLILNSDIYSSVLTGHKIIVVICDNAGFAVINKLQNNTGNDSFNNLLKDCATTRNDTVLPRVDFTEHARSLGANAEKVNQLADFSAAFARAQASEKTYVITVDIDQKAWSSVDVWWEVGIPEESDRASVREAKEQWDEGRQFQRKGI